MRSTAGAAEAYSAHGHDAVRETFEVAWFRRLLPSVLRQAGGGELLDLGCGDGTAARLAGSGLTRYVGVDLRSPGAMSPEIGADFVAHDLRQGLGPVGSRPFDLYLGTFGVASHLAPQQLSRLLRDIAAHARPGALVALEALGLHSLEWPQLWNSAPGPARTLGYRLGGEVRVHPWAPGELFELFEQAGIRPLRAADRTLQAGPKLGAYWPGFPPLRAAVNALLAGSAQPQALGSAECARIRSTGVDALAGPLPPLPAGAAALFHHTLAARRRALVGGATPSASGVWKLEPRTGRGLGHGLLVVGRVSG